MPDTDTLPETQPTTEPNPEAEGAGEVTAREEAPAEPVVETAGEDSGDGGTATNEPAPEPSPAPAKRPRGRPRKDGLPPGSPEAKAKDAGEESPPEHAPAVVSGPAVEIIVPAPAVSSPPAPKVREQERTSRAKHPRARPLSEQPKQEPAKNVCTNQNCRAVHPSQGGKAGVRCVETGALVVAPLGREEGRELMRQILSWIGKVVAYAFGGEVSDPTAMELGIITPPAIRIAHRFGIGEGNFTLDILMLLAGLSMYTMRVISEARSGGQRVALPAAA